MDVKNEKTSLMLIYHLKLRNEKILLDDRFSWSYNRQLVLVYYNGIWILDDWAYILIQRDYIIFSGYIQPELIKSRFERGDVDGFLDRHWFSVTGRRKVYFKEIGRKADKDNSLAKLFLSVYKTHHDEKHEVRIGFI